MIDQDNKREVSSGMDEALTGTSNIQSEKRLISLAKAISWRTAGSLSTVAIVYFVSGQLDVAAAVGGIEVVAKIALFYIHERLWARIITYCRHARQV